MRAALELDDAAHVSLAARAAERGIEFLSTPFDLGSLGMLTGRLGLRTIKIGSGDLTNAPLLHAAAGASRVTRSSARNVWNFTASAPASAAASTSRAATATSPPWLTPASAIT
jgi:hypothetical protein